MIEQGFAQLSAYLLHLLPGLALCALWFWLTPKAATGLRILILLLAFVLVRDAMTPHGLWSLTGHMRIGFSPNPMVLLALGAMSVGLIALLPRVAPDLWRLVIRGRGGLLAGLLAGCAIGLPLRLSQGLAFNGDWLWLGAMTVLAFGGNALEEVLFRGLLQGHLERHTTPLRAALGSGVAFSACHCFLALVVTQVGWPILAFTLIEGVVCGLLRMRYGVLAAIAAHGTAILLIATPMS